MLILSYLCGHENYAASPLNLLFLFVFLFPSLAFFSVFSLNQMASVAPKPRSTFHSYPSSQLSELPLSLLTFISATSRNCKKISNKLYISSTPQRKNEHAQVVCQATQVSVTEDSGGSSVSDDGKNWIPVVPLAALPKGERRVIIQNDESILLLWYKDQVLAIENRSPAEGAYTEGLLNAKLTQVSKPFYPLSQTSIFSIHIYVSFEFQIAFFS